MKRILLTSHGRLASGLKDTLEFFLGQSEMIAAVDAYVDTSSIICNSSRGLWILQKWGKRSYSRISMEEV